MPMPGSLQKDPPGYFSHKKKRCCVAGGPCQRRAAQLPCQIFGEFFSWIWRQDLRPGTSQKRFLMALGTF
jgi:hypothetical protein